MLIKVDGVEVPRHHLDRYAIRFSMDEGRPIPAMYRDGKRVTKTVRIDLELLILPDEAGESANTA